MAVHFTHRQWENIRENYTAWWAGDLQRPLIHMTSYHHPASRPPSSALEFSWFMSFYGDEIPASDVLDLFDFEIDTQRYLGDAFPNVCLNFGAGVMAAFLGAQLQTKKNTTWFHPERIDPIEELNFVFDPDNRWLRRLKEIIKAAFDRWGEQVLLGMTDLGGTLDILSSFRPGELLLTDLCLAPEEVKRLIWQLHELWHRVYADISSTLKPQNPGHCAWTPIYSAQTSYMLQSDFAYMLGPDQFEEFVRPELEASCKKLANPFYHLDGVGQLAHLDSLLSIKELKGIQWVPGEGKPSWKHWPDVYRKIRDAGKLIQVWGPMEDVDSLIEELGSGQGIIAIIGIEHNDHEKAAEFVNKHCC